MVNGAPFSSLRDTIFTHPTMTEGLTELLAGVAEIAPAVRRAS
jgi:hypothetical protein